MDLDIANKLQNQGCSYCGGPLHHADYPRVPFGIAPPLRAYYQKRLSLCCGKCRKRSTPPSVRFFGKYRIPEPWLVLISALQGSVNEKRCAKIKKYFGVAVSSLTWKRWQQWWRALFTKTLFWQEAQGHCFPKAHVFPRALLILFQGSLEQQLCYLLKFLSPLTAGVLRAV